MLDKRTHGSPIPNGLTETNGDPVGEPMMAKPYVASISKSQGRAGWSVIFRHPVRTDEATGKAGLRVRQGLGTRNEAEAKELVRQLNELLAESQYHDAAARAEAERRFDSRAVEIFFYKMTPEETDYQRIRDDFIRLLDSKNDDYRRVLLLGTTGAGKTTLGRQLIGTDPEKERFPSTSTAKTTIHDTEIVVAPAPWKAIVTFASMEEVREYLTECVSAAALSAWNGARDSELLRRLLNHVNQRFRFSYVLGNGSQPRVVDFDDDNEEEDNDAPDLLGREAAKNVDMRATNQLLGRMPSILREIAKRHGTGLRERLEAENQSDKGVVDELFEDEFDNLIRSDEQFHGIADDLLDEIEKRFDLLETANIRRTKQGWPLSWSLTTDDRATLIQAASRFSSNHARYFGQLLTPLVNGVRVSGPFSPIWSDGMVPKLVLLDGEGLGHTPSTSASVSTSVTRRIEEVDAVLLVDSAAQPMQAAPVAAMRELARSGNAAKLILVFTHFDEVKGDNLPTPTAKVQHVMASAENVLAAIGEDLGPFAERSLRKRLDEARVFLARIDEPISDTTKEGARTISQLEKLLTLIDEVVERPEPVQVAPCYDRMDLVLAVKAAAEGYHDAWFPRLGLDYKPGVGKEHWTRVKALSRRLATGMADCYDSLQPVADLRKELLNRIYVFVQNPVRWQGAEPADDEKQTIFDALADAIGRRLLDLATQRVWKDRGREWQNAYNKHGRGSTFVRADIIGTQILEPAAPIPDLIPSIDRNQFLRAVAKEVAEAAAECGAVLV
jgi:hypothetical protein